MIENNFIAGFVMLFSFIAIPVIGFKLISSILKPVAKEFWREERAAFLGGKIIGFVGGFSATAMFSMILTVIKHENKIFAAGFSIMAIFVMLFTIGWFVDAKWEVER